VDWRDKYDQRFYSTDRGWVDGTREFHTLCARVITPHSRILEIGAGPSNATSRFLATLGTVTGLDPDPDVLSNDALAEATVLRGNRFPFEDRTFDACVSNYVVEHLGNPRDHLVEVRRVLKPGGAYVFRTPNLFHYVAVGARLTPHWVHLALSNRMRGLARTVHEPYPTKYRMNSSKSITLAASAAGFEVELIRYVEKEPTYGRFAKPIYLVLMLYERIVNSSPLFAGVRANLFVVLRAKRANQ